MFDLSGLFTRASRDDARTEVASARPIDFVVHKDGKPFAILNATPALAERTIAGFERTTPQSAWSLQRV